MPLAPPERLVVGGLYRCVRIPMCLAGGAVIVGQALPFSYPGLLLYAAACGGAVCAFVYGYEEPTLARRCGAQYGGTRSAVPASGPRIYPWEAPRDRDGAG